MKTVLDISPVNVSPRIQKLVDDLYSKNPEVEAERAFLLTESYKKTESLPMVLRRAKALEHILDNMTLVIRDGEMIVGNLTKTPHSTQIFPEYSYKWLPQEFDTLAKRSGDVFEISGHAISGHSLKHWVAAAAALPVLRALQQWRAR